MQLMQKLQKRFGYKEIPETAQLKLSSLMQGTEEIMEEWADRVFQLALRAYEGLPEHYMLNQAIKRICHGCKDKDAGKFAINQHPDDIEEPLTILKVFNTTIKQFMVRSERRSEKFLFVRRRRRIPCAPTKMTSSNSDLRRMM